MNIPQGREIAIGKIQDACTTFLESNHARDTELQFDIDIVKRAHLVDASMDGKVTYEIELGHEYSSGGGVLHGAAAALLLDTFTTMAFLPLIPTWSPNNMSAWSPPAGITRALNLTYIRPLRLPATIRILGEVVQYGRTLSLARGSIVSTDGKTMYCTGEHHKAMVTKQGEARGHGGNPAKL